MLSIVKELRRRNVFKVAIAYAVVAWLLLQIADVVLPTFKAPEWVMQVFTFMLILGFPLVLIFAWAYELTPEGIKKEKDVDRTQSTTHVTGRKLDYLIITVLVVMLGYFAVDKFMLQPSGEVEKSIAVLPFVNMSDDAGNEYFSDGISEELLDLLAKIPELRVISRSSAFALKGEKLQAPEVAQKLNVAHVLEGSVRKSGNRVRITAQLIEAHSDTHLWSETYERTLEDIFAIQEEIASAVVDALRITLLGGAPKVTPIDPEAYALYMQANHLHNRGTDEALQQSTAMLQQVLAVAPDYAKAWRALGRNYSNQVTAGLMSREEGATLAKEAIDRALAIDPNDAEAWSSLGTNAFFHDGDLAAAARHFTRALSLEPTNSTVLHNAGALLASLGRPDEATVIDEYNTRNDPLNVNAYVSLALGYLWAGRPNEAIAATETILVLSPGRFVAHRILAQALLLKGENEAALEAIQKEPSQFERLRGMVMVYHALGRKTDSDEALAEFIERFGLDRGIYVAELLAYRGESDRTFEWLVKAVDSSSAIHWQIHSPVFGNIHDDPRWLPFLERNGRSPEQLAAIEFEVTLPE